jgi:3-phosphoshikimate 1-carboxyvinyltransferase
VASNRAGDVPITLHVPGSKSLTNRALLLAALADGESTLENVLFSDDTRVMLDALAKLGFKVQADEPQARVTVEGAGGRIPNNEATLFLGNAGTAMRFLTAACCLGTGTYLLDGNARMRERPIGQLVDTLNKLGRPTGTRIEYVEDTGYPPLRIEGRELQGGPVTFPKAVSSQYVSALLQIGPYFKGELQLQLQLTPPLTSDTYVVMTEHLMAEFGVATQPLKISAPGSVVPNDRAYQAACLTIEPDASNASYFLAASALMPDTACTIHGLGYESVQGDAVFARDVLSTMGALVKEDDPWVAVTGPSTLKAVDKDLIDMPDMAQTLAVLAVFAEGPTTIRGIGNLRVKETDRIAAIQNELQKLGVAVTIHDGTDAAHAKDDITITPPPDGVLRNARGNNQPITADNPVVIETYDDHRMAMSFALLGLRTEGILIDDPACVNKTFPDYFDQLAKLGVTVEPVQAVSK